jgi:hypothetical protein
MASVGDIATVRKNINEPTDAIYKDEDIGVIVDSSGVAGASAIIWREKAARYASLVSVSESGASHSYSDLHKNALAMAKAYDVENVIEDSPAPTRMTVKKIIRL